MLPQRLNKGTEGNIEYSPGTHRADDGVREDAVRDGADQVIKRLLVGAAARRRRLANEAAVAALPPRLPPLCSAAAATLASPSAG